MHLHVCVNVLSPGERRVIHPEPSQDNHQVDFLLPVTMVASFAQCALGFNRSHFVENKNLSFCFEADSVPTSLELKRTPFNHPAFTFAESFNGKVQSQSQFVILIQVMRPCENISRLLYIFGSDRTCCSKRAVLLSQELPWFLSLGHAAWSVWATMKKSKTGGSKNGPKIKRKRNFRLVQLTIFNHCTPQRHHQFCLSASAFPCENRVIVRKA